MWGFQIVAMRGSPDPRTKQDRREVPAGTGYVPKEDGSGPSRGSLVENRPLWGQFKVPDTEYEALMECAPLQEPPVPLEELRLAALAMGDALECLTPIQRSVLELVVVGGMSLREAGRWLAREFGREKPYSAMGVSKIRDAALVRLREYFGVG